MLKFNRIIYGFVTLIALEFSWIPVQALDIDTSSNHYYLMSYFNDELDGLKYAISTDGDKWEDLSPPTTPMSGGVGLGSWSTQVEFDSISVTSGSQTLFSDDFSEGASKWTALSGEWEITSGVYGQTSSLMPAISAAYVGANWKSYTYHLKARKKGGDEGFLIPIAMKDTNYYYRANIAGWKNTASQFERVVNGVANGIGTRIGDKISSDTWYDIKIVFSGSRLQCFMDGKLSIEYTDTSKIQSPVYLRPGVDGNIMRDPSLFLARDGVYHCVWTSSTNSRSFGHATSKDLIHWSTQGMLPVMSAIDSTAMCWAPEIFYDDIQKKYMLFWTSAVKNVCSCWYVTTTDFKAYSDPKILFTSGDGSYGGQKGAQGATGYYIFKNNDSSYILLYKKNDDSLTNPVNFYRIGKTPQGPWGDEIGPIIPAGVNGDGPAMLKFGNEYRCYVDPQADSVLYYYSSTDLLTWTQNVTTLPFTHGTPVEISRAMAQWLVYGKSLDTVTTAINVVHNNPNSSTGIGTSGKISLQLQNTERINVRIVNQMGRMVYTQSWIAPSGMFTFDAKTVHVAPGIYYGSVAVGDKLLKNFRLIRK